MVQSRSRNKDHLKFYELYFVDKMACQLQPECNFLLGFFKCKLPVEVVDVEVKVTSMQGTHLYKRDQTMQVTKCVLWTNNIRLHPTIIKKMKTFLEVENKMGTTIQTSMPNSQFRPSLPETNPNVCRSDIVERRKTITPKRKFRPGITDNPKEDKCRWGPNCPFCKVQEKKEENPQQRPLPGPQTQKPTMTKSRQLWEAEMERLNDKYNLDCFSDSELDSELDEGEEYHYEHGYETLI